MKCILDYIQTFRGYSKTTSPENQLFLTPLHPSHFFITNITNPLPPMSMTKVTKFFQINYPRKCTLGLISCMFITQYPIPNFHFRTVTEKTELICTSMNKLDIECSVTFKVQKLCFEKTFDWRSKRRSQNMLSGFLQNNWEIFCKNTERCSAKILRGALNSTRPIFRARSLICAPDRARKKRACLIKVNVYIWLRNNKKQ